MIKDEKFKSKQTKISGLKFKNLSLLLGLKKPQLEENVWIVQILFAIFVEAMHKAKR